MRELIFHKAKKTILVVFLFLFYNIACFAQCKSVVSKAIAKLDPFIFNGQTNLVTASSNNSSIIHLSFYKGYYYKIQLNYENVFIGNIHFRVFTENREEVYNSVKNTENNFDSWIFFSNTAQNLTIEVYTKEKIKTNCTAVLVGVEIPKKPETQLRSSQSTQR